MNAKKKTPKRLALTTLTVRSLGTAAGGGALVGRGKCHLVDSLYNPWSNKLAD